MLRLSSVNDFTSSAQNLATFLVGLLDSQNLILCTPKPALVYGKPRVLLRSSELQLYFFQ